MNKTDKLHKSFVIFSAARNNRSSQANEIAHLDAGLFLQGIDVPFKEVQGFYKGHAEKSYYVETNSVNEVQAIKELAVTYGQESILIVDADRTARLLYLNKNCLASIGTFKQVGKYEALDSDSYTYDAKNKGYYICE